MVLDSLELQIWTLKQCFEIHCICINYLGANEMEVHPTHNIISSGGTGFEHPLPINKLIRHACAYWTSSSVGRETEEIR